MVTRKDEPKKISKVEWTCDICNEAKKRPKDEIFKAGDYYERICVECYDRGLLWSIKEAYKWKAQVKIDALKKSRDNE